jgi:hypothetical protein
MGCGRIEALHVVERERWIDKKTEQAGADEVPEEHGGKEAEAPVVDDFPFADPGVLRPAMSLDPTTKSGTTSSAENTLLSAITDIGVPEK